MANLILSIGVALVCVAMQSAGLQPAATPASDARPTSSNVVYVSRAKLDKALAEHRRRTGTTLAPHEAPAGKAGAGVASAQAKRKHARCYTFDRDDFLLATGVDSPYGGTVCTFD